MAGPLAILMIGVIGCIYATSYAILKSKRDYIYDIIALREILYIYKSIFVNKERAEYAKSQVIIPSIKPDIINEDIHTIPNSPDQGVITFGSRFLEEEE